jgi:hypothetical protein
MASRGETFVPYGRPHRIVSCCPDLAPIVPPHLDLFKQMIDLILGLFYV